MKSAHWAASIAGTVLAFAVTTANAAPTVDDVTFNGVSANDVYI